MSKLFVAERDLWICEHMEPFKDILLLPRRYGSQHSSNIVDMSTLRLVPNFAKYDQASFDSSYDSAPLEFFEPMVRQVMAKPINSMYAKVTKE